MPQAEALHPAQGTPTKPSPAMAVLAERLRSGTCHIGIYGLGYVGLPLALRFAEMGIRVTGFDIDPHKVDTLNSGNSYIERITAADINQARQANFTATTEFAQTAALDAQIICVPTPLDQHHQPDLSFVINTVESICRTCAKVSCSRSA